MGLNLPMPPQSMDARTYAYLYQMVQLLNSAAITLDGTRTAEETTGMQLKKPSAAAESKEYNTLRSLIVKNAKTVQREMDELTKLLEGSYVAQSDFGTYVEQLSLYLQANPEAITQYYTFAADLKADVDAVDAAFERYKTETGGYIRTGIVYRDNDVPVYGVAVGQDLTVREVDGETVVEQKNFRSVFTATRLSFWQDDVEVAYISNNTLYIKELHVLRRIQLGAWMLDAGNGLAFKWIGG